MTTTVTDPTTTSAGSIGGMVNQLQGQQQGQATGQAQAQPQQTAQGQQQEQQEQMVLVPAGFLGNILSGVSGTVGQAVGGYFGNAQVGRAVGDAASPLLRLIPWSNTPPAPAAQQPTQQQGQQEQMVLVPAGFFGDLLSGAAGTIGSTVGGWLGDSGTGRQVGNAAAPLLKLIPWSAAPPAPQPTQQSQQQGQQQGQQQQMVLVPAGFFGDLLSGAAGTVGEIAGGIFGDAQTGRRIGEGASPFLKLIPWNVAPPAPQPAAQPTQQGQQQGQQQEQMVLVPAGFLGSLLGGLGGNALGGWVGGMLGNQELGKTIGSTVGGIAGGFAPFSIVPA